MAFRAGLEAVHRVDVVKQKGQIEDLQLLGVFAKLGQRRRNDLHITQQQRLQFLAIAEQLAVGEYLHLDLARHVLLDQFLELQRRLALGRDIGHHVAVFDDDGGRLSGHPQRKRGGGGEQFPGEFHGGSPDEQNNAPR